MFAKYIPKFVLRTGCLSVDQYFYSSRCIIVLLSYLCVCVTLIQFIVLPGILLCTFSQTLLVFFRIYRMYPNSQLRILPFSQSVCDCTNVAVRKKNIVRVGRETLFVVFFFGEREGNFHGRRYEYKVTFSFIQYAEWSELSGS